MDKPTFQKLHDMLHLSLDLFCIAGLDGYFQWLNPRWEQVLGWPLEALISRSFLEFVHPEDVASTLTEMDHLGEGANTLYFKNRYRCSDGSWRWLEWNAVPEPDGTIYAVARDVTENQRLQEQLLQSERLASLGTMAAGITHEINNPLAWILGNLEYTLEGMGESLQKPHPPELADWHLATQECLEGANRVRKIVRGLKSFARLGDSQVVPVKLTEVLEATLNITRNQIRQRAQLVCDFEDDPTIEADENQLVQVFLNLLLNAIQALPETSEETHTITLRCRLGSKGQAIVEVQDTGPGIPERDLDQIFEPFFTTKTAGEGTGLGLAVSQGIITRHKGSIEVESKPGQGTLFRIELPTTAPSQPPVHQPSSTVGPASEKRGRILIIDDEVNVIRALERILRKTGLEFTGATTGTEGLAMLQSNETFELVLCDLMMPDVTGMEIHGRLMKSHPERASQIVFMTGNAYNQSSRLFLKRTSNIHIEKPFDLKALEALLQNILS